MPQSRRKSHAASRRKRPSAPALRKTAAPTTALIKPNVVISAPAERPWELNDEQLTILKNSIAKGASDEELKYCLTVARRYKLDPFRQQIWFIKRWDRNADNGKGGTGAYVWTPQVGIYGMAHIAARDHADYGSISKPEYGPAIEVIVEGHKIKAPQWASVKIWKKGLSEPAVGEAWFEEYCPKSWDNVRLFWATMQHRMIAKCAKAQGLREAYPDLGGLYIPEECQRIQGDFTESGRQIIDQSEQPYRRQLDENARVVHDSWPTDRSPAEEVDEIFKQLVKDGMAPAEADKEANRRYDALRKASKTPQEPPKNVQATTPQPEKKASPVPTVPQEPPVQKAQAAPPMQFKGTVEIDCTVAWPIVRGDLANIIESLQKVFGTAFEWGADSWWHVRPKDVAELVECLTSNGYKADVKMPPKAKSSPSAEVEAPTSKRSSRTEATPSPAASPAVVSGTIERVNSGMAGKYPVRQVTVFLPDKTKPTYSCFDKALFEHLDAGLGKVAELVVKQNGKYWNITGLRKIGSKEWDETGVPVIQNRDRESTRTLF